MAGRERRRFTVKDLGALLLGRDDTHCYQHLVIHDAEGDLLYCALLPGKGGVRTPALAALREVVERLRAAFPKLELRVRADNGFACPELYDYCDDNRIEYFAALAST